jgi:hypothetical protein
VTTETDWMEASRVRDPVPSRRLLDEAVSELVRRGFTNLEHGARLLHHIVSASLSIQCENLGVPYDADRMSELTGRLSLSLSYDHVGLHPFVDVPEGWCEAVDRMFKLRTCAHCGAVLFPGSEHPREECDAWVVRGVMES